MNRIFLLLGVLGVLGVLGWYGLHEHGRRVVAEAQVRGYHNQIVRDRNIQRGINDANQKQFDEMAAINAGLADDLERLRDRPARRVSDAAGPDCTGGTGADLSGEDAGFLTREAARADTIRGALIGCYAYADSLARACD